MTSPLILIKTFEVLESVFICLFPLALVTSITLTGILIYLGAFSFGVLFILKQKKDFVLVNGEIPWHIGAFLIYIFAFTLTKFVNSGTESAFHTFFRTSQDYFLFLWVLIYTAGTSRNQKSLKAALLFSASISIIYGILQFFHFDIFSRQINIDRLSGFHKNPYSYAGQMIIFFFLLLNVAKGTKGMKNNYFKMLILIPCFFCILNASERSVILGVCIGLFVYLILENVRQKDLLKLSLIFFIPALLTIIFNKKVFLRIKNTIFPEAGAKPNVRFKIWQVALGICKRNILFGVGKFPTVYHQRQGFFDMQILTHAHNVYLQILVTNGLVGLIAFLNLFYSILKILFVNLKNSQYSVCLISILVAFFVEGIFEYFWGDSEVRYLLLYFIGFVFGTLLDSGLKEPRNLEKV